VITLTSRSSLLKLYFFVMIRKKRFLGISLAFVMLSLMIAYLDYLSIKNGMTYVAYEDLVLDTFNFIVIASIMFAGDLVSEDLGSNVKYILLQFGSATDLMFSKLIVALFSTSLVGYLIPVLFNLIVISACNGLPDMEYIGILYLYVIAYTTLNALISALLYNKGSKMTLMVNIILWEVIYFVYSEIVQTSAKGIYYTSLPILAEGLYYYYYPESIGFKVIKPDLQYSIIMPIIVSVLSVILTYLRVRNVKV